MKRKSLPFIVIIFVSAILIACPNPKKYSEIPEIEFRQVVLKDTVDGLGNNVKLFKLIFGITDGDGNIGFRDDETPYIYNGDTLDNNFFTTLHEVINGDTIEADSSVQRNFRVPYVEPEGQNKTLIAEIIIDIEFSYNQSGELPYDSIFYEFYIVDRELNESNRESTLAVKLDTLGFFPQVID